MVPVPPWPVWTTPEVPCADWPPLGGQSPLASCGQSAPAVADSHSVKFLVVPDSSERFTGVICVLGSLASGLSALILGSSHLVILRLKMPPTVAGESWRSSTPSSL